MLAGGFALIIFSLLRQAQIHPATGSNKHAHGISLM
jgi:hypothetical protein